MDNKLNFGQVRLIPLRESHYAALAKSAEEPSIWRYNPSLNNPKDFKTKWFEKALLQMAEQWRMAYVIDYQGTLIGSTSFYDLNAIPVSISIGYTWLHPLFHGQGINTICKYLLLDQAFETLSVSTVYFAIDSMNMRSRHAVEKLGAKQVELIKNHLERPDGSMRDTVKYAITSIEWPGIKAILHKQLSSYK